MRDVVTKWRRLSLAGRKTRTSFVVHRTPNVSYLLPWHELFWKWDTAQLAFHMCAIKFWTCEKNRRAIAEHTLRSRCEVNAHCADANGAEHALSVRTSYVREWSQRIRECTQDFDTPLLKEMSNWCFVFHISLCIQTRYKKINTILITFIRCFNNYENMSSIYKCLLCKTDVASY